MLIIYIIHILHINIISSNVLQQQLQQLEHSSLYHIKCNDNNNDDIVVSVCIGTESNCFPFKISTSFDETFILDGDVYARGYKYKESPTYKDVRTTLGRRYNDDFITGRYAIDDFHIQHTDIVIKQLQFIIVEKGITLNTTTTTSYIGVIGIGNEYAHSYKECGLFEKVFQMLKGTQRNISLMKHNIFIGSDMNMIKRLSQGKVMKRCNMISDYYSSNRNIIACQIDSSFIYDERYSYIEHKSGRENIKFNYDIDDMYIPYHVYEYIKMLILPSKGECYENITHNGKHIIQCNFNNDNYAIKNEIYLNLQQRKIFMFINNFTMRFILYDLFNWNEMYFRGIYHEKHNEWILGKHFLNRYILTIDKHDNYIYITNNS